MSAAKRRKVTADGPPVPAVKRKCDLLYDECVAKKGIGEIYSPDELLSLGVTDDAEELAALCQELLDCQMFVAYTTRDRQLEYRPRAKEEALKLA
jgi:hypothetical protein